MTETGKDCLNENEKLVLEMLKYDFDEKEISQKLGISEHTVNAHKIKLERLGLV